MDDDEPKVTVIGICTECGKPILSTQSYAKSRRREGDRHHIACERVVGEESTTEKRPAQKPR